MKKNSIKIKPFSVLLRTMLNPAREIFGSPFLSTMCILCLYSHYHRLSLIFGYKKSTSASNMLLILFYSILIIGSTFIISPQLSQEKPWLILISFAEVIKYPLLHLGHCIFSPRRNLSIRDLFLTSAIYKPSIVVNGGITDGRRITDLDEPITGITKAIIAFNNKNNIPRYAKIH